MTMLFSKEPFAIAFGKTCFNALLCLSGVVVDLLTPNVAFLKAVTCQVHLFQFGSHTGFYREINATNWISHKHTDSKIPCMSPSAPAAIGVIGLGGLAKYHRTSQCGTSAHAT